MGVKALRAKNAIVDGCEMGNGTGSPRRAVNTDVHFAGGWGERLGGLEVGVRDGLDRVRVRARVEAKAKIMASVKISTRMQKLAEGYVEQRAGRA